MTIDSFLSTVSFQKKGPVVMFTKASRQVFTVAQRALAFLSFFKTTMFRLACYLQVLQSVVILNAVLVMDDFVTRKVSAERRFNYEAMLKNITISLGVRMLWHVDQHVSPWIKAFSTFPVRMLFTCRGLFSKATAAKSSLVYPSFDGGASKPTNATAFKAPFLYHYVLYQGGTV